MAYNVRPVVGKDGRLYYKEPEDHYDSYDSGADAALLSEAGQAEIAAAKRDWLAAQAAGDQAGMDAAHARAEAVRAKAGYSGGANGGAYNELYREDDMSWAAPSSGSGGGNSIGSIGSIGSGGSGGYTKLPSYTSRYQDQIDALTQELLASDREKFSYREAPAYSSRYQDQIDALSRQILNRKDFSYDPEQDPTYRQYRESYTRGGQRAMQDTLGQVSARTGGLASSYAESAAQQTYDGYMSALADRVPELRQLAYQMYLDEWNGKRNELSTLQGLEASDYNRYLAQLGQYNADRSFDYGAYRDELSDMWRALNSLAGLEQADYNRYRDQVGDLRYADETAYNRGVYADETAYNRRVYADQTAYERGVYADETDYNRGVYADETDYNRGVYEDETDYNRKLQKARQLAESGDFSGYRDLGYSEEEIRRMQAAFLIKHPELAALYRYGYGQGGSYVGADSMGNTIYFNNGVGTYSDGTRYYDGDTAGSGSGSGYWPSSTGGVKGTVVNRGGDVSGLGLENLSYSEASELVRQGKVEVYTDSSGRLKYRWANGYNRSNYNR